MDVPLHQLQYSDNFLSRTMPRYLKESHCPQVLRFEAPALQIRNPAFLKPGHSPSQKSGITAVG